MNYFKDFFNISYVSFFFSRAEIRTLVGETSEAILEHRPGEKKKTMLKDPRLSQDIKG